MTDKERQDLIQFMRDARKNVTEESARALLIEAGIYTEKGVLAEPYKNLYIPRPNERIAVTK
ncbi:MAG: hypothetical protein LBK18_01470 [Prevotellaceae bacterium]|jgi:hypothetical protein|nr:hypothetical protein [Prevotellaceae bacterium]